MLSRRSLLCAMPALICAPAIVRASSLMPVKAWSVDAVEWANTQVIRHEIMDTTLRQRCLSLAQAVEANNALMERIWLKPTFSKVFR